MDIYLIPTLTIRVNQKDIHPPNVYWMEKKNCLSGDGYKPTSFANGLKTPYSLNFFPVRFFIAKMVMSFSVRQTIEAS